MSTYPGSQWVQNTSSSTAKTTQTRPTRGNFGLGPRLGPLWDHTLCAMVNDLRVCERLAASITPDDQRQRVNAMFWGSSCRRFTSCQPDQRKIGVSPAEIRWLADQEDVELETIWDHAAASRYLNSTCPTV